MPVPRLPFNYHQVLKLHPVLLLLRVYNNTDDDNDREKVYVEVVADPCDPVVHPQTHHKEQEAATDCRLNMLPLHRRDHAQVDY
jgi:hypothetical protein